MADNTRTPIPPTVSIEFARTVGADIANEWINRDQHALMSCEKWQALRQAEFVLDIANQDDFLTVLNAWKAGFNTAMRSAGATPLQANASTPVTQSLAIARATDAANVAMVGMDGIEELRSILRAIWQLSAHEEVIFGLARLGVSRAENWFNSMEAQHEAMGENVAILKGANHA